LGALILAAIKNSDLKRRLKMRLSRFLSFFLLSCFVFPISSYADQLEDAKTAFDNKDYERAYELLAPLAQAGHAEAQTRLGAMYVNGQGVEQDFTLGFSWIMKAGAQGYETARRIAFKLCLDLVNQGDTTVMYNLGYMCLNGWGGEYDTHVCLGWLENAGKIGHEKSSKMLAKIYTEGLYGMTPDEEKANYWSNLSAAFAAGIDGKWEGAMPTENGRQPIYIPNRVVYNLEVKGDKLTGTMGVFGGQKFRIRNGKIDGNEVSFTVKSALYGMRNTTDYTGTFLGDRLKLTSTTKTSVRRMTGSGIQHDAGDGNYPPVTFTLTRVE
jgi:hypothetical protein